jgi:cysteine desulfurase
VERYSGGGVIYLDYAATTPLAPAVLDAMLPFLTERFGNASEPHWAGRAARAGLVDARARTATVLGVAPHEVIFTGGGSEADNMAILGRATGPPGRIVATAIEHPAVREPVRALGERGWEVAWAPVDGDGALDLEAFAELVQPGDDLACVMWANNVTGVVQPVAAAAAICAERGVPLHLDAVQAPSGVRVRVGDLEGDVTVTLAAHKLGGPKGVGAVAGRGVGTLQPAIRGGGQERGLRPGTENVAGCVGLATALELRQGAVEEWSDRGARRDRMVAATGLPAAGARAERLPGHALLLTGARGDMLVHLLDERGIAVAAGSACSSGDSAPSHVLVAMGLEADQARGALRVSLGPETTDDEVDAFVAALAEVLPEVVRMAAAAT